MFIRAGRKVTESTVVYQAEVDSEDPTAVLCVIDVLAASNPHPTPHMN